LPKSVMVQPFADDSHLRLSSTPILSRTVVRTWKSATRCRLPQCRPD
jgi:hypothetical protein